MAKVDAVIVKNSDIAPKLNKSMAQEDNMKMVDFRTDANLRHKPEYFVYLFNIAPRVFEVRRPPLVPCLHLKACPTGERYTLVATLPDIVQEKWVDPDSGEIRNRGTDGLRVAMDICNPINTGVDLDAELPESITWTDSGAGDNLSIRGLFFSLNQEPTEDELRKARTRMEKFYRGRIARAEELARDGQRNQITVEMHMAADYFHAEKYSWHTIAEVPTICENCGEDVRKNAAYHINGAGVVCVRDWQRTVASGAKKREDVPVEARWWDEPKRKKKESEQATA